jgi:hypothetical protein
MRFRREGGVEVVAGGSFASSDRLESGAAN